MAIEHSAECIRQKETTSQARAAWSAQWPNHCRRCDGYGGEWSGHGDDSDFTDCPDCLEQGKCPRCGTAEAEPDQFVSEKCHICGFDLAAKTGWKPREYDGPCSCEEAAQERQWEEDERVFWERFGAENDPENEEYIQSQNVLVE